MKLVQVFIGLSVIITLYGLADAKATAIADIGVASSTNIEYLTNIASQSLTAVREFGSLVSDLEPTAKVFSAIVNKIRGIETDVNKNLKTCHTEVVNKLGSISAEVTIMSNKMELSFAKTVNDLANKIDSANDFSRTSNELSDMLEDINIIYLRSVSLRNLITAKSEPSVDTVQDFVNQVFGSTRNVQFLLQKVHSTLHRQISSALAKDYLQTFETFHEGIYAQRCDKTISPNQQLYYIYLSLIANELKGIEILSHAYQYRSILTRNSFAVELQQEEAAFKTRITDYKNSFQAIFPSIATDIRRCGPPANKPDQILELKYLANYWVQSESNMHNKDCKGECSDYNQKLNIEGSAKLKAPVTICPAESTLNSYVIRNYQSVKQANGKVFGSSKPCSQSEQILKSGLYGVSLQRPLNDLKNARHQCDICGYSNFTGVLFDTRPVMADFEHNKIVTGVQFSQIKLGSTQPISQRTVTSIKIKTGLIGKEGHVTELKNSWISLTPQFNTNKKETFELNRDARSMYLDDVITARGYAVTGVRFFQTKARDGVKLMVHGTKYDFVNGRLNPTKAQWFDPEEPPRYSPGYIPGATRQELVIGTDCDVPTAANFNSPRENTNEFVKFTHTSIEKDVGQTTIPMIDAQPVIMGRAFPLNGVGVYYKGAAGYGGYVAPRIFTDSPHNYFN